METQEPIYKVEINGKDATKDLSPYVLSLTYVDNLNEKADEVKLELDNSDFRFSNEWFMSTGMTVKVWIGQMFCGTFTIDDNSESGLPHIAEFRAQSAEFSGPIRTKKSFTHYQKSLKDVVDKYAKDHKLKVVGTIPDLNFQTLVQFRESDIDFLHRVAKHYGCICSVKGQNLVFDSIENIWKNQAATTLHMADFIRYRFQTSLPDSTDSVISAFDDVFEGKVQGSITESGDVVASNGEIPDHSYGKSQAYKNLVVNRYSPTLPGPNLQTFKDDYNSPTNTVTIIHGKVESTEEANRIATGALLDARIKKYNATITVPGNELLVAGNSVHLLEVGKRSGYWLIESSTHLIVKKQGYTTTIKCTHGAQSTGAKVPADVEGKEEINKSGGVAGARDFFEQNQ